MKTAGMIKIAASSLVLGAALTPMSTLNASKEEAAPSRTAAESAQAATKALQKRKFAEAIAHGETAVAAMPRNADYRALLGQAYLLGGRFQSAETMLGDAAALDPSNVRAGLNLALAQIAVGHQDRALATLDAYRERLTPADYGLAVALAGDVQGGVQVLEAAVRETGGDVKTRQNLALTYALAGRWSLSKVMASQDLSADLLTQRMADWAQMAFPSHQSQQVATILKVTPVYDPGQPQQLALNAAPAGQQVAMAAPVAPKAEPAPAPVASFSADPAPVFEVPAKAPAAAPVVATAPEPAVLPAPAPVVAEAPQPIVKAVASANSSVIWGERKPVVQAIPVSNAVHAVKSAPLIKSAVRPAKQLIVPAGQDSRPFRPVEGGQFVVQLGAFASPKIAEAAWANRLSRQRLLSGYDASTARFEFNNSVFYRLSVTGFGTRASANQLCNRIKASGGQCFVRAIAGDQPLQWAKRQTGTRIAAR